MGTRRKLLIGFGVFLALIAVTYINLAVYPFTSEKPNFSDVERVFNRMQFPAEWQETDSSENRGVAGRRCPIEPGSACFHIRRSFAIPPTATLNQAKEALRTSGCSAVSETNNTSLGSEKKKYRLDCSIDGLDVGADYVEGEYFSVSILS